MLRWLGVILVAGLASAELRALPAADVTFTISSRETYVGAAVEIQVVINRARRHEPPAFPEIHNAEVRELRKNGTRPQSIPRVGEERSTTVYTYAVVPRRAGTLTIPPIRVSADGDVFSTSPIPILVRESEAGDLLYLQLLGERESVYVGDAMDVTLEMWLKPYGASDVRMDAQDMWRLAVDERASAWGVFTENLQGHSRDITNRTETRPGANGREERYFVYSLKRKVWPKREGVFDAGGIEVVVNYPLKVRRNPLTLHGRPYEVNQSRPISAVVENSTIVVKTPPMEGRPDSFRGAVGEYTMTVAAAPTGLCVGDPITLTLAIRSASQVDFLQAPLLAKQELLTADFRVPDDELAGVVAGAVKTFIQNIRPRHHRVTEIPPIEFSYFDPQVERYVVLKSDPIPLQVREAARLPVTRVVYGENAAGEATTLTQVESGLLANYDDVTVLLRRQSVSFGWGTWGFAASGPLLYTACLLARRRHDRLAADEGFGRRRSAREAAMAAIRRAVSEADGPAAVSRVAAAVTGYVADRCNLPPGSLTRKETVNQLRIRNAPEALILSVDDFLGECETARYGAAAHHEVRDIAERARSCVGDLERWNFSGG